MHSMMNYTALHAAAEFGTTDIIKTLCDMGMAVNVRDLRVGQTPLHYAAAAGKIDVALLLLSRGSDRTVGCNRGDTLSLSTHPTLSKHLITTYQPTHSTHPINPSFQPTLSTHLPSHPPYPPTGQLPFELAGEEGNAEMSEILKYRPPEIVHFVTLRCTETSITGDHPPPPSFS